jgi:PAS domain S-box-containing protein
MELEEFFDLSIDLLCIVGFDGHFKRVSASLERALGFPAPELFARSVFDITHPDDIEPSREALAQLGEGHDLVGFESRVVCADGSVRWLEWNTRTMPERGVVFGVARDTTERRRAEAELRDAKRMLEASRDELRVLAEEQAALRRVATLVARGTAPDAVFAAVGREVGQVLGVDATHLGRFDPDGTVVSLAQWGSYAGVPIGARFALEGDSVSARVLATGRPARMDRYGDAPGVIAATVREIGISSCIGVPISVAGRPWGVMIASSKQPSALPPETESRLQDFTELVGTAIANAEARAEVARLADEQAALRRIATLVAEGARSGAVFDAVTREVAELLNVSAVSLTRYDDDALTVVAQRGASHVHGAVVAAPAIVDGRTWGVLAATWTDGGPPPADTEARLARFAALLGIAIANADSREQLTASRARVLAAGDEARRRVVRDLHDGAQQSLVQTTLTLKLARRAGNDDPGRAEELMTEALGAVERATVELRELAHGILPSVLAHGGLRAAVEAFVARVDVPVDVDVLSTRLPPDMEASAYFIVAEALTNVAKHAQAQRANVTAAVIGDVLTLEVRDDGIGGASPTGQGLVGVADRVDALGGRLRVESAAGEGTVVTADLPLSAGWPREPERR